MIQTIHSGGYDENGSETKVPLLLLMLSIISGMSNEDNSAIIVII